MFRSIFNVKPSIRHLTTEAVGGQWVPKKRVSRPTMEKIRALAATQPDVYNIVQLSKEFTLSTEAIRRILKSNYVPTREDAERQEKNRYEAMGERRKEFRAKYNIPEDKEKAFWKRDQQEAPPRKTGTWSNDTYKKRNASYDSRSKSDQAPFEDRKNSFSRARGAEDETRSFRRNDDNRYFRESHDNKSFRQNNDTRKPFRRSDDSERPYKRNNSDEKESFYNRQSYNRGDTEQRPYRRRNDHESKEPFHNKQFESRSNTEERAYSGNNDRGFSFNKQRSYSNRGDTSYRRENNGDRPFRSRNNEERPFKRESGGNRSFKREGSS